MSFKVRKPGSKLLGIGTFLLFLILKGASPKPAYAFVSSLDACAAQPECAAAISSEVAPAVATPTATGVSATITSTTATGASTTTQAAAGVAVVGDMRLSGIAAYYLWSQGVNGQAQEIARQRYCAAYPGDSVCGPFTGGQGDSVMYRVSGPVRIYYHSGNHTYWYTTYADLYGPITSAFWEEIPQGPSGNYNTGIRVTHAGQSSFIGGWQYTKSGVSGVDTGQITVQRVDVDILTGL